jgi:hypothetical protein
MKGLFANGLRSNSHNASTLARARSPVRRVLSAFS